MEQQRNESQAESFSRRSGTLISKQFIPIGSVKSVKVQIAVFSDLISGQKEKAVRFEYETYNSYSETTDAKIGVLDGDEIEGLVKSINIIRNQVFTNSPAYYTEVNFVSRGGFSAGTYFSNNEWSFYLKIDQYDSNSYVWLKKEDSSTLLEILTTTTDQMLALE